MSFEEKQEAARIFVRPIIESRMNNLHTSAEASVSALLDYTWCIETGREYEFSGMLVSIAAMHVWHDLKREAQR
jgi:hypothetical protein